jgi:hypothetical protein
MDAIIGGATILAALVGAAGDGLLRRLMFIAASVGALALVGLGIYEVLPKPAEPYPFLSVTCGSGLTSRPSAEVFPYVLDNGEINLGIGGFNVPLNEFATCLIRNEGDTAVENVKVTFAYRAFFVLSAKPGKQSQPLPHFVSLVVPHVGLQGAYITVQNRISGAVVSLFPTYVCSLENPKLAERQSCRLPMGAYGQLPYLQGPAVMLPPAPRSTKAPVKK